MGERTQISTQCDSALISRVARVVSEIDTVKILAGRHNFLFSTFSRCEGNCESQSHRKVGAKETHDCCIERGQNSCSLR